MREIKMGGGDDSAVKCFSDFEQLKSEQIEWPVMLFESTAFQTDSNICTREYR